MLRSQDSIAIRASLDELVKKATKIKLDNYEPTISEIEKINKDIYEFIKKNKLIIYGGFAQNYLIGKKDSKDMFYDRLSLADVEFYHYDPIGIGMELSKLLYSKGYKYVVFEEGVHEETYNIFVNFQGLADISYMPKYIYDNCPTINVDGFRFTHPHFMMVDAFRQYSDPIFSFWRLEKTFSRFSTLDKHYPLANKKLVKPIKYTKNEIINESVFKNLRKTFLHNKDLIVIHHYGYNYLLKKTSSKELVIDIPYLSVISPNYTQDIKDITKKLEELYPNKIKVKEFYPFFQFLGRKTEFYLDNKLIFVVYSHNKRCTVYQANYSENKKTLFATFSLLRLMFLAEYFNQMIHDNKKQKDEFMNLLQNLFAARNNYFDEKDLTAMDDTVFQEFTFECIGSGIDTIRQARLKIVENIKKGKSVKFRYNPDKNKEGKAPKFNFENSSGNPIINLKDFTISKQ